MSTKISLSDELNERLEAATAAAGFEGTGAVQRMIEKLLNEGTSTPDDDDGTLSAGHRDAPPEWWTEEDPVAREHMRRMAEFQSLPDGTKVVYPNGRVWVVKRAS
jgi:hypothetical protein